jgi:phosphoglucosamine mutase
MKRDLFGTDGVRGLAGEYPLDKTGTEKIGMAVGTHFAQVGQQVIIGCDTRESSKGLVAALASGLTDVGVDVTSASVIPTPGLAYLTRESDEFVAGVMVTASHNPYQYNGIKVFDAHGDKLSDDIETALNSLIEKGVVQRDKGNITNDRKLIDNYEDFLVKSAEGLDLTGLTLAIDTANGAASGLAARVFSRLGAKVTPLFDSPDGRNINAGCGATDTRALANKVVSDKLTLGIALDGDADRLIMIDSQGREVKGDYLMYILAVSGKQPGVVATVMSNLGFELALKRQGIKLERTDVGDRYVLEGLRRTGYKLGGEQSGHIILPERLATGDGLLAAVQVLRAIKASGKDLAAWCDEVSLLPQAIVNIPLADKAVLENASIKDFVDRKTNQLGGKGRLLIRPSGTEPLARIMVEAEDAQAIAESIAAELKQLIAQPVTAGDHA